MQKVKIFCLLVSFQIFSSILLKEGSIFEDLTQCSYHEDSTQCSSVKLETKGFQCCSYKDPGATGEKCEYAVNPIQSGIEEMATENGKLIFKEAIGYNLFHSGDGTNVNSFSMDYKCEDGDLHIEINNDNFTEEEKKKFKSDNLCLRFFYSGVEEEVTEDICYNSEVATAKEGSGISCGFYEFTLNLVNGTSEQFKTCHLFNDDIVKTKNMRFWTKMFSIRMGLAESGNGLSNYRVSFSNSKGNTLIYDSSTDTIYDPSSGGSSKFISYRYLSLLSLLLI